MANQRQRGFLITSGVLTILPGVAEIIVPGMAKLAVELLIGVILVFNWILQGVHAFHSIV